jgi:hypothetical protein
MKTLNSILFAVALLLAIGSYIDKKVVAAPVVPQAASAGTLQGTAVHTTCLTPAVGAYFLCLATDGIWISNNGAAYFQIVQSGGSAGVTSITVNGGTAVTGAVALTIPTKATSATTTTIQ